MDRGMGVPARVTDPAGRVIRSGAARRESRRPVLVATNPEPE
jgi:hypothetical protein